MTETATENNEHLVLNDSITTFDPTEAISSSGVSLTSVIVMPTTSRVPQLLPAKTERRLDLVKQMSQLSMGSAGGCPAPTGRNRRLEMTRQISQLSMGSTGGGMLGDACDLVLNTTAATTNHTTTSNKMPVFHEDEHFDDTLASDPTADYGNSRGFDAARFHKSLADIDLYKDDTLPPLPPPASTKETATKNDFSDANSVSFFSVDLDKILARREACKRNQ